MPHVRFTSHLTKFFPGLGPTAVAGGTVADVVSQLDERYPGIAGYIVDDRGALRKHVNIFVGETLVRDRTSLQDAVGETDEVYVMQALSGG
jgi:molybdopterin converting factor small subunit